MIQTHVPQWPWVQEQRSGTAGRLRYHHTRLQSFLFGGGFVDFWSYPSSHVLSRRPCPPVSSTLRNPLISTWTTAVDQPLSTHPARDGHWFASAVTLVPAQCFFNECRSRRPGGCPSWKGGRDVMSCVLLLSACSVSYKTCQHPSDHSHTLQLPSHPEYCFLLLTAKDFMACSGLPLSCEYEVISLLSLFD